MYAVIETGGKQYRVELGSEIEIEKLDAAPGDTVAIDRVLLVADGDSFEIGRPLVEGAQVSASIVRQDRGDKIVVFKYRPKARHRVKHGHRQDLTVIRIADIRFDGRSAAQEAEVDARKEEQARAKAEQEAARQAAADQALAAKLATDEKARADAEAKTAAADAQAAKPRRRTKAKADEPASDEVTATEATADATSVSEATVEDSTTEEVAADDATSDEAVAATGDEMAIETTEEPATSEETDTSPPGGTQKDE